MIRLDNALAEPPVYIYVVFFGYFLAMACFGIYRPRIPLVALVSLYTLFIGLVLYLILALSDPFQGGTGVEPTTFEHLVTKMRAEQSLRRCCTSKSANLESVDPCCADRGAIEE